jgi:homoserine kinase type II
MTRDVICLGCPNGCRLTMHTQDDQEIRIRGHSCERGVDFVRTLLEGDRCGPLLPERSVAYDDHALREIAAFWEISLKAVDRSLIPDGSPERTLFRAVIEDRQGNHFVLERIPVSARYAKMRIIQSLAFLAQKGLAGITPYRIGAGGEAIHRCDQGIWQLAPYVPGIPLDRLTYLYEGWRAETLSRFLIELSEKSRGIPFFSLEEKFSLKDYIYTLVHRIERHARELLPRIGRTIAFLERDFMDAYDRLPAGFCHGDYHPLNIVWGKAEIRSVIDWEFTGIKPEIYDLANMVGCLGIEHPSSLAGDLVTGLIARLRVADIFSDISWGHFIEFVVALRFAWLSEWLRKDDREMIDLELAYMDLLISNNGQLRRKWKM